MSFTKLFKIKHVPQVLLIIVCVTLLELIAQCMEAQIDGSCPEGSNDPCNTLEENVQYRKLVSTFNQKLVGGLIILGIRFLS